jgi:hypothetical protein
MTKEALKLALEALQNPWKAGPDGVADAIIAIKAALKANDEPVAWGYRDRNGEITDCITPYEHDRAEGDYRIPLYTTSPQRKPLTDEEIVLIVAECAASHQHTDIHFARAIETKLKEKTHELRKD